LLPTKDKENPGPGDLIKHIDSAASRILCDFYDEYDLDEKNKAFPIKLSSLSASAGLQLPDQLIVFPNFTFDYVSEHYLGSFYYKNPLIEDDLWNDLWQKFSHAPRDLYKRQRKEDGPTPT
jgi:hypothetical protein